MDWILLGLVAGLSLLSIPLLWLVVLIRGSAVARLEQRLARLEALLAAAPAPNASAPVSVPTPAAAPPPAEASPPEPAPIAAAAAAPEPVPAVTPARAARAAPRAPRRSVEDVFMSRWAPWIAALALFLGGAFLVKEAIERGWLGPTARVIAGVVIGLALTVAGEVTRRRPVPAPSLGALSPDDVPPALAAAGIAVLFASIYAGYALYALIPASVAFLLLAAVSFGGAALSLLHGMFQAALGMAGAYVVPLLVVTPNPSVPRLLAYVLAVTAGNLWLVRWRDWPWLGWAAIAGSGFYGFAAVMDAGATAWIGLFLLLLAALFVASAGEAGAPRHRLVLTWCGLGMAALIMLVLALDRDTDATSLWFVWAMTALYGAVGVRWPRFDRLPWIAALLQVLVLAGWVFGGEVTGEGLGFLLRLPPNSALGSYMVSAAALAALAGIGGFLMLYHPGARPDRWAALSAATPLAVLIAVYWRVDQLKASLPWAGAAFLLAVAFLLATEDTARRRAAPGFTTALAAYALAATGAVALALTLTLRLGWLTVALSLELPAIAWLHERLGVPLLRRAAFSLGAAVLVRLLLNPAVADYDLGTWPMVNGLLYTYGIPAAAFAATAFWLRRSGDDAAVQLLEAGSLALAMALISLEIRHLLGGGRIDSVQYDLLEQGLQTDAWLAVGYLLLPPAGQAARPVRDPGWRILAGAAVAHFVLYPMLIGNPLLQHQSTGALAIADTLFVAYAVPAMLGGLYYRALASRGSALLARFAGVAALALAFAYLSLEVRHLFQGAYLDGGGASDAEWYAYSAVWLAYGAVLLGLGILRRNSSLRGAGLVVGALVAVKAFGFDMATLTGLYRAASFLGLGASLIAIAWFYQRMVAPEVTLEAGKD
ncbi:MAG TPA: DUF2339 domain-containing protein [Stellaceae bacterium]|nr:DUF2339 domain-containing protein [Stellaceae bacterium]